MKKKYLFIGLAMSSLCFSQAKITHTCVGVTTKGKKCKAKVNIDVSKFCHWHDP